MPTKRALHDPRYYTLHKFPKQSGTVSVLDEHRLFPRVFPELTKADHLRLALDYRVQHNSIRSKAIKLIQAAEKKYGHEGTLISGGLREYWPTTVKNKIRACWPIVNNLAAASESHWLAAGKRGNPPWRR